MAKTTTTTRDNSVEPPTPLMKPTKRRQKQAKATTARENPSATSTTRKKPVETCLERSRAGRVLRPTKRFNPT